MSERLRQLLTAALIKQGMAHVSRESGLHENTVRALANGESRPRPNTVYKLAKACGLDEAEALKLAEECSAERPKRTA